jgi:penicillin-binding protein 1A
MDSILIKILATALTFSQVATDPEHLNTQFDPAADQARVVEILQAGCAHMRKAFDIEAVNLDDLISVAMDDPETVAGGHVAFKGMELKDLQAAYQVFCKREPVAQSGLDIGAVIGFYNRTLADLPDHTRLKSMKLPGTSMVLDLNGEPIAEVQEQFNRRQWIPLSEVPETVQRTFIGGQALLRAQRCR